MLLGSQLRRFREAAGITPEQVGYEIRASRSKISRLENGRVKLKNRDVMDLLTLYGVTDEDVRAQFKKRDLPDVVYLEQLTGVIYLDQRADVEHYLEVVDELSVEALTPEETTSFIEQVARGL